MSPRKALTSGWVSDTRRVSDTGLVPALPIKARCQTPQAVSDTTSLCCDFDDFVERGGVFQGASAGDLVGVGAEQDLLHGQLELLAAQRRRNRRDLDDLVRHMARRQVATN